MSNTPQPIIKRKFIGGREVFEVFSPTTGEQVATFYNSHFLTVIMQEVFGLSPFEPLPITEESL